MSAPKDGGPAFPVPSCQDANGQVCWGTDGMTLRDYFAAEALNGFFSHPDNEYCYRWQHTDGEILLLSHGETPASKAGGEWRIVATPLQVMARAMYDAADAMLAERERTTKPVQ